MNYSYFLRVLVAFDVFMSTVLGFSYADCTISACCGLALEGKRGGLVERWIGTVLNYFWPGHTSQAIADDMARAQAAVKTLS